MATPSIDGNVKITAPLSDAYREILSAEALERVFFRSRNSAQSPLFP